MRMERRPVKAGRQLVKDVRFEMSPYTAQLMQTLASAIAYRVHSADPNKNTPKRYFNHWVDDFEEQTHALEQFRASVANVSTGFGRAEVSRGAYTLPRSL